MEAAEHYNLGVQAGMEMNLVEFMINAARRKPGYLNPWYAVGAVADALLRMASREGKAIDAGDTLQWP